MRTNCIASPRSAMFVRRVSKATREAKITEAKIKYARKLLRVCKRGMKATRRNLRKALQEAHNEDVPSWHGIQDSSSPSGGRDLELISPPSPTLSVRFYASSWNGIQDPLSASSSQMETSDEEYDPRHPQYIFPVTEYIAGHDTVPDSPEASSYSSVASWNSLQDAVPSDEATTMQEAAPRVHGEDIVAAVDPDGFHFLHSYEDESVRDYSQMHTRAEAHVDADGFHFLAFWPKRRGSSI